MHFILPPGLPGLASSSLPVRNFLKGAKFAHKILCQLILNQITTPPRVTLQKYEEIRVVKLIDTACGSSYIWWLECTPSLSFLLHTTCKPFHGLWSGLSLLRVLRRSQDQFLRPNRTIFLERFFGRGITAREQLSRAVILARF